MIHFNVTRARLELEALESESHDPHFYLDPGKASKILQSISGLKNKIESFSNLCRSFEDVSTLTLLAVEENDDVVFQEAKNDFKKLSHNLEKMRLDALLSGTYDKNNAILTLHAGAGGTESQDWCAMLLRMYVRWAERRGFKVATLDCLNGEEAGIKSVSISLQGLNVYGYLKSEKGVHRLVRISPFDSSSRRHTSFASVEVMPEIDDDVEIKINSDDLRIDTYRSSGAGGQHVNKTESAVRITHLPTGVVVTCQNERSQHKNKDIAMKMLKSRLLEIAEREQKQTIEGIRGVQYEIGWGSQIRSYVFHPYNMVKDHRTNFEVGNIGAVMDGDLDGFINAFLKAGSRGELE